MNDDATLVLLRADNAALRDHNDKLIARVKELEAECRHSYVDNGVNDRCDVCGFDVRDAIHERVDAARKQP